MLDLRRLGLSQISYFVNSRNRAVSDFMDEAPNDVTPMEVALDNNQSIHIIDQILRIKPLPSGTFQLDNSYDTGKEIDEYMDQYKKQMATLKKEQAAHAKVEHKQPLNYWQLAFLGVGNIIASGIYMLQGIASKYAGNFHPLFSLL